MAMAAAAETASDRLLKQLGSALDALDEEFRQVMGPVHEPPTKKPAFDRSPADSLRVRRGAADDMTSGLWRALEKLVLEGKLSLDSPEHARMVTEACGREGEDVRASVERVVTTLSRRWGGDSARTVVPGARNAENFCYGEALLAMFLYPSQFYARDFAQQDLVASTGFQTLVRATGYWLAGEPERARRAFHEWVVVFAHVYKRGQMGNPTDLVDRFEQEGDDALVDPALFFSRLVRQTCKSRCSESQTLESKEFISSNTSTWTSAGVGRMCAALTILLHPGLDNLLAPDEPPWTFAELWSFLSGEKSITLQRHQCSCGSPLVRRIEVESAPLMLFFYVCDKWQTDFDFPGSLALKGATYQLVGRIFCTHRTGVHYFCRYLFRLHEDDSNPVVVHYDSLCGRGVVLGAYADGAAYLEGSHKLTTNVLYMRL